MKNYFAYTRVSTDKQGEQGASLPEQKEIIQRYAIHKGLSISRWFEEIETASKIGRPIFNEMLSLLKKGTVAGVIIHKVDRGARNFRDWAEIGELRDAGIEVHFATESLDLSTLGGMLSADLQAVMSVHYSRNLREEVKKGFYGRLKQGLYPKPAPLGYANNGKGKPKTIDPIQGPIVREAFELYATGRYSLRRLAEELYRKGLRTRPTPKRAGGKKVCVNSLAWILSNPFYMGVLYIKKEGRTYIGAHQPLISRSLFGAVQNALTGKSQRQPHKHQFLFSRLIACSICSRSLIGEVQKSRIYYRCHSQHTAISLREDRIQDQLRRLFEKLQLSSQEVSLLDSALAELKQNWQHQIQESLKSEELRRCAVQSKLERLTDVYLEGMLDKSEFERKKIALTLEQREIERKIPEIHDGDTERLAELSQIVELTKSAYSLYESGNFDEKREVISSVVSNRVASHKFLNFTLRFPFSEIAKRNNVQSGGPLRDGRRIFWRKLIKKIVRPTQKDAARDTLLGA